MAKAFGQRGVWVSVGHPIADFRHPNIHIFCAQCNGIKKNWTPNSEILAKALLAWNQGPCYNKVPPYKDTCSFHMYTY